MIEQQFQEADQKIDNTFLSLKQGNSADIRIKTFVRYYEEENLNLRPNYQRNEVINRTKASRVVESAILGIPIPPIYLFKDKEGRFEVIDGQQRLISFLGFLGILIDIKTKLNKFALLGLEILSNLNGKNTENEEFKIFLNEKIRDFTLRTIIFEEEKGFLPELKYEIFERLNKDPYPIKANSFELWNCVYLSNFTRIIKKIANNKNFLNVISRKSDSSKDLRMDNENDILRYICILKHYDKIKTRIDIPKIMALQEVKEHFEKKTSEEDCNTIYVEFMKTIENIKIIFNDRNTLGNTAYNAEKNKYPNLSLIDVMLVVFNNENNKFLQKYRDEIYEQFKLFFSDNDNRAFMQNARSGISKVTTPINDRVDFLKRETIDKIKFKYGIEQITKRIKIRDLDLEQRLLRKQKNLCVYCHNLIKPGDDVHIDHMKSIHDSGCNEEINLAIMHKICNLEKGKKSFINWQDIINCGEHLKMEFKSSLRWDYRKNELNKELSKGIAKVIVSYLNTTGGTILIGVTDNGTVIGIENDYKTFPYKQDKDSFQQALTALINESIGKEFHQNITTTFENIDSKDICVIEVEQADRPAYLRMDNNKTEFYIRANSSSLPMSVEETIEYVKSHFE